MFDVASAVAYLETTLEMLEQLGAAGTAPTVFYMSSSGKGQAGIVLARKLWGGFRHAWRDCDPRVPRARRARPPSPTRRSPRSASTSRSSEEVVNFDDFVGKGYGIPSEAGDEAVRLFARTEALILDPIYTGKAAAGMIAHIREGRFSRDDVVFVHTGGTPAIFTWNDLWTDAARGPLRRSCVRERRTS